MEPPPPPGAVRHTVVTLPCAVEPPEDEEPVLQAVVVPVRPRRVDGQASGTDDFRGVLPRASEPEAHVQAAPPADGPPHLRHTLVQDADARRSRASRVRRDDTTIASKSSAHGQSSRSSSDDLFFPRGAVEPEERPRRCRCPLLRRLHERAAPRCRAVNKSGKFQFVMFFALACALFLPDIWILLNRPGNSDLDVILSVVMAMFLFELLVQLIGTTRTYFNSFFFWTDVLGAFSLLLDLTFVTDRLPFLSGGQVSQNTVVMRAARVAKLGARAGRFTKLVKLLRFLPGMRELGNDQGTAKVISGRLNYALSLRVSCLIIVLVMILPLFSVWSYPEQDWSMGSFIDVLSKAADPQSNSSTGFAWKLDEFALFYADLSYYPYRLEAKDSGSVSAQARQLLPWRASREAPPRAANSMVYESDLLKCSFNFEKPNKVDALLNILLMLLVMMLMVGFSVILSSSVSKIVLKPLENLLMQVRNMAAKIFKSVNELGDQDSDSEDGQDAVLARDPRGVLGTEVVLLERVIHKLGAISNVRVNKSTNERDNLAGLGDFEKAVIQGFQGGSVVIPPRSAMLVADELEAYQEEQFSETASSNQEDEITAQQARVTGVGLSMDLLDSWNMNPLELDRARNHAAMLYFVGSHNHGISYDAGCMEAFLQAAEAGHNKSNPYHNWFHAIDSTHCVYRLMKIMAADSYLSNLERFGLIVSAVCHDIGHPGLNSSFLVETSDELAVRYNDKSPLENMHCAKLFELVSTPACNIFAGLSRGHYQEIRKVCIDAILHTDNVQHFSMIKEVQMMYEVNSEILDMSRGLYSSEYREFPVREAMECYRQPDVRKLLVNVMLHISDFVSTTKPFRICRIWASQVLEEFFMQGDKEKLLGTPIQALNDRERTNRAFSQIGFIEFLVSPLLFATVKVLPPMEPQLEQMIQNVKTWHSQWLESTPPPSEEERKAMEHRIAKLEHRFPDAL